MKPRTLIQKEAYDAHKELGPFSDIQMQRLESYFISQVYLPITAYKSSYVCLKCGHRWDKGDKKTSKVKCPSCKNMARPTRERTGKGELQMAVVQRAGDFQVVRYVLCRYFKWSSKPVQYFLREVYQTWIKPGKKTVSIGCIRTMNGTWSYGSFEVRSGMRGDVYADIVYPRYTILPVLKRNGFSIKHTPHLKAYITRLLYDPRFETLVKYKDVELIREYLHRGFVITDTDWRLLKILMRNNYRFTYRSFRLWKDYKFMMVQYYYNTDRNVFNPVDLCPKNIKKAHDDMMHMLSIKNEREAKRDKEAKRVHRLKMIDHYNKKMEALKNFIIEDGLLKIVPLCTVDDIKREGAEQEHCVYQAEYFSKKDSLLFTSFYGSEKAETIEYDISRKELLQAHGRNNNMTRYHNDIIRLFEQNAKRITHLIKQQA